MVCTICTNYIVYYNTIDYQSTEFSVELIIHHITVCSDTSNMTGSGASWNMPKSNT